MRATIDIKTSDEELAIAYRSDNIDAMFFDPAMNPEDIVAFLSFHKGHAYSSSLLVLALRHPQRSQFDADSLLSIFAEDAAGLCELIGARTEVGTPLLNRAQLETLATFEWGVAGHAKNALVSLDIGDSDPDTIAENLTGLLAVDDPSEDQYRYCAIAASHPKTPIRILEVMARRGDTLAKIVRLRADWQGRPDALDWRKS